MAFFFLVCCSEGFEAAMKKQTSGLFFAVGERRRSFPARARSKSLYATNALQQETLRSEMQDAISIH